MLRISLPAGLGRAALVGALALPLLLPLTASAQDGTTAPAETVAPGETDSPAETAAPATTAPADAAPVVTDPMDVFRIAFEACLAEGVEGADCAEQAKEVLLAVMSGGVTPQPAASSAPADAPDAAMNGGGQTNTSSGQDGQISRGNGSSERRGDRDQTDDTSDADGASDDASGE